jgi:hypothetical protein
MPNPAPTRFQRLPRDTSWNKILGRSAGDANFALIRSSSSGPGCSARLPAASCVRTAAGASDPLRRDAAGRTRNTPTRLSYPHDPAMQRMTSSRPAAPRRVRRRDSPAGIRARRALAARQRLGRSGMHAKAVELDLMRPVVAGGNLRHQLAQFGLDPLRRRPKVGDHERMEQARDVRKAYAGTRIDVHLVQPTTRTMRCGDGAITKRVRMMRFRSGGSQLS